MIRSDLFRFWFHPESGAYLATTYSEELAMHFTPDFELCVEISKAEFLLDGDGEIPSLTVEQEAAAAYGRGAQERGPAWERLGGVTRDLWIELVQHDREKDDPL